MKTEIKILKALLEEKEKSYTTRELSKKINADYKIAYVATEKLYDKGLIKKRKLGNTTEIKLSEKFSKEIFEAELERRENLLQNRNLRILYEKLSSLPFSFIALIFGSFAKGKIAKGSDIDLMVICEKNRIKEVESVVSLLPLNIHLVVLNNEEFLSMAKSKEFSVVSEAMKSNVILIGIENYYKLIKNVE